MNKEIISFNTGEMTPKADSLHNIDKYQAGCRHLENLLPRIYGSVERRPGTIFLEITTSLLNYLSVHNVSFYGAVGDGVTDDTVAIQSAIDAANTASGGCVYFPAGLYQITDTLTVGNSTRLCGSSQRSQIRLEAGMTGYMVENKDASGGNNYIEICDLTFQGNRANAGNPSGIIFFDNVDKFSIHDCWLINAYNDSIYIDNSFYGRIHNNYTEGAGADSYTIHNTFDLEVSDNISYSSGQRGTGGGGIVVIDSSGRIVIDGNICKNAGNANGNGIVVQASANCVITNNICSGNNVSGIETDTGDGRHNITGNQCVGNTARGIYILNSGNTVSNNIVTLNGSHGISVLSPAERNILSGNTCGYNGYNGIELTGEGSIACNNVCTSNEYHGLEIDTADKSSVTGNICRNNSQTAGYSAIRVVDSDDCTVSGNVCFDDQDTKTQRYGVQETGSDYNIYIGNNFKDELIAPYTFSGVNNIITNNITDETVVVASATTVTLPYNGEYFEISGTTNITSITASRVGRKVVLKFAAILTFTDGSNLKLAGNLVSAAGDTITLICDGTNWNETSRSVN